MDLIHKVNSLLAQPPAYWINAANQRLPDLLSVVFVVAIAWYLAKLIWVMVPQTDAIDWSVKGSPQANVGQLNVTAASSGTFRTITSAHLFGEADAEAVIVATVDAPETRLNLKLRATVATPDQSVAHAIIADGKGSDNVYFIGETVAGGAKLHEVHPDKVILNRGGSLETLKLPKISESLGRQSARSMPTTAAPVPQATGSIRQAMDSNVASFTDILRPQPYMPNGELKGYRVYPGRDRRKFAALGLRPGDLVTELNGSALTDLQSGMEVFKNLGETPQITVTIERNGSPMTLTLDTNQIMNAEGTQE